MTAFGKKVPIPILPYVNPYTDAAALDTMFFSDADKVRFQKGKLRKIKGWERIFSNNFQRIIGAARNVFSCRDADSNPWSIIGTHRSLYALKEGTFIYNITPIQTSTNNIANSLSSEYNAGVNVDVTTTLGSNIVTIAITQYLNTNDSIKISGVGSSVNGIPAGDFNNTFAAQVINNNEIEIRVATNATSSGTVSVNMTWATSYIYVYAPGFGPGASYPGLKGDRIKIQGASAMVGGIATSQINKENYITNVVNSDKFVFQTDTIATSLTTNGGGGAITIQYQILPGYEFQSNGWGYGGGEYSAGLYGESKEFTNQGANTLPRIWSMDKFYEGVFTYNLTLGNDPLNTIDTTSTITFNITTNITLVVGDSITISGAADTNGITAGQINGSQVITALTPISGGYTVEITTAGTATSTGTGGGSGVVITLSTASISGTYLVLTPGDSAGSATGDGQNLYRWDFDITVAPVLISPGTNPTCAPYFVKWVYVSHDAICTLGGAIPSSPAPSEGILNQFISSNLNDYTDWSVGPNSYALVEVLDDSGPLISQASTRDYDMLFTEDEIYRVQFVDKPNIWGFSKLFTTDGIMAQKSRAEVEDAVIWMGKGDFFVFDGTSVDVLPNNTLKRFVYDNLDQSQYAQCFSYANTLYNEVWFFWVKENDTRPNNYAMYNYVEKTWVTGTLPRTASEEPLNINATPLMMESLVYNTFPISMTNGLSSYFFSLSANPLTTVNTQQTISFNLSTTLFLTAGDFIKVSGAVDTNGILAAQINGIHEVTSVTVSGGITTVTYTTLGTATSSGTGGGSAITIGTAVIGINVGSYNVRISANELITVFCSETGGIGGIPQTDINVENQPIRAIVGDEVQFNNASPSTVFSTSQQTVSGEIGTVTYNASDRLFQQELGYNDYNPAYQPGFTTSPYAPMLAYAVTSASQLGDGDDLMTIYSVYPDTSEQVGDLTISLSGNLYPSGPTVYPTLGGTNGIYTVKTSTTKFDTMFQARQRQYRFESNVLDGNFLIGRWFEELKSSSTR